MSFSIGSTRPYEREEAGLFDKLNSSQIRDLRDLKSFCGAKSTDELVGIVKDRLSDQKKFEGTSSALVKLLKIAEGDSDLYNKISTLCRKHGITRSQKAKSSYSENPDFTSLKSKVPCYTISSDILRVPCLDQNTLEGGSETCAFHSLKNALCISALSNGADFGAPDELFNDPKIYDNIHEIVCRERGESTHGDASVPHLRSAWKAILEMRAVPFPGRNVSVEWKANNISFFDTAGRDLTITDSASLESLLNLNELTKQPGPCSHAFIVGGEGHWVAIFYEKNPQGKENWYGFDSISDEKK